MKKLVLFTLILVVLIGSFVLTGFRSKKNASAPYTKYSSPYSTTPNSATTSIITPTSAMPTSPTRETQLQNTPSPTSKLPQLTPTLIPPGTQKVTYPDLSLGIKKESVTAKKWSFSTSRITAKVQQLVHLEITSTDADYGFALKDLNVIAALTPGKKLVLEIVPDRKGTFAFECMSNCQGNTDLNALLVVE